MIGHDDGSIDPHNDSTNEDSSSTELYASGEDGEDENKVYSNSSLVHAEAVGFILHLYVVPENSSHNSNHSNTPIDSNEQQQENNVGKEDPAPHDNSSNEGDVRKKPGEKKPLNPKSNKQQPDIKSYKTLIEVKRETQITPPLSKRQRSSKLLMATYSSKHIKRGNDGRFHCDICHRHYKEKKTLNAHLKVHFQSGAYNCSHCKRNFHNKNEFKRHEASHLDE